MTTPAHVSDFLLELGCEDLPARYVVELMKALVNGISFGFLHRGISWGIEGDAQSRSGFATPRRIAVLLKGVAREQPEQSIEKTGPALSAAMKDGKPTPAALGFAKSCGVEFSAIGEKDGKLHFARKQAGRPTAELIPEIFEDTLKAMDALVPKRMRWGSGEQTFVRPVSWIVCLLGADVVPLTRFGVASGRISYGHRFHAPAAIALATPADYAAALKGAKVWSDVASRKAEIRRQIEAKATALGGHARITEELLDEVTALVEWPVVIAGQMEKRFTDELPREVIVATVETNQRYFTVFADAALSTITPHFITIANIESRDEAQVVEGNERVVRPRLSDALFFWEQDKKQPFASYREKLKAAMYQKELGTQDARVERIKALSGNILSRLSFRANGPGVRWMPLEQQAFESRVLEAADLCKNDLVTKMVFEFPELQGIMGGYYVTGVGSRMPAGVGLAVREHYLPTQTGTPIPGSKEGQVLAVADKLDALAGIFAIGQKPTASKDPFALRRAANGVLRICIEADLPLDLDGVLDTALKLQPTGNTSPETHADLLTFVMERMRAYLVGSERGGAVVSAQSFEAVSAVASTDIPDFVARLDALLAFSQLEAAGNLAAAHKRVRNILKQAGGASGAVNAALFESQAEAALFERMKSLPDGGDYGARLTALATLREPVDAFFAAVMVNADDPAVRANRLALLAQLDVMCREVADISLLPG